MTENQYIKVYSFGFTFNGITFCWYKKELLRMPYSRNNRYYEKRKLKLQKVGNSYGYWIDGNFKSLVNLKEITRKIKYTEDIIQIDDCPF